MEVEIETTGKAVRNVMKKEGIVDGIAKRRIGVIEQIAEKRVQRAQGQLKSHPLPENWKNVLFSDEVHFGWSDEGRLYKMVNWGTRPASTSSISTQTSRQRYETDSFLGIRWLESQIVYLLL
jgi:hypothetical protein